MAKKRIYTKAIGLVVTEDAYEKIQNLCDQQEISISEWLRDAIEIKLSCDNMQNERTE